MLRSQKTIVIPCWDENITVNHSPFSEDRCLSPSPGLRRNGPNITIAATNTPSDCRRAVVAAGDKDIRLCNIPPSVVLTQRMGRKNAPVRCSNSDASTIERKSAYISSHMSQGSRNDSARPLRNTIRLFDFDHSITHIKSQEGRNDES
jgi:hypothetical protein